MDFIKVTFKCNCCEKKIDIFFKEDDGINGVFDHVECRVCKKIELIGVGDLGYRIDFPDPDYPPWQAQFIRIDYNYAVCSSCSKAHSVLLDYNHLISDCYNCNGINTMKAIQIAMSKNDDLFCLITKLSQ